MRKHTFKNWEINSVLLSPSTFFPSFLQEVEVNLQLIEIQPTEEGQIVWV